MKLEIPVITGIKNNNLLDKLRNHVQMLSELSKLYFPFMRRKELYGLSSNPQPPTLTANWTLFEWCEAI